MEELSRAATVGMFNRFLRAFPSRPIPAFLGLKQHGRRFSDLSPVAILRPRPFSPATRKVELSKRRKCVGMPSKFRDLQYRQTECQKVGTQSGLNASGPIHGLKVRRSRVLPRRSYKGPDLTHKGRATKLYSRQRESLSAFEVWVRLFWWP